MVTQLSGEHVYPVAISAPGRHAVMTAMTQKIWSHLHLPEFPAPEAKLSTTRRHQPTAPWAPALRPCFVASGAPWPRCSDHFHVQLCQLPGLSPQRVSQSPRPGLGDSPAVVFTQTCFPGKRMLNSAIKPTKLWRFLEQEALCSSRCCETFTPDVAPSSEKGIGISVYPFKC